MSTWRIGKQIPINVYEDDRPVCQCHTATDARRIAAAMNRVREIAQELDDEFGCDCGADDADWKRKNAGKMYNTESGHAIECPKFKIAEILRKFGLEP
jgi:hypothetical protein